jgi:hypothetical protein
MFYSTHMLGRKGPLAVIWVAAHKDPKFLKRAFVDTTSINAACGENGYKIPKQHLPRFLPVIELLFLSK